MIDGQGRVVGTRPVPKAHPITLVVTVIRLSHGWGCSRPLDFLPWIFGYHGIDAHLYSRHNIFASVLLRPAFHTCRTWHWHSIYIHHGRFHFFQVAWIPAHAGEGRPPSLSTIIIFRARVPFLTLFSTPVASRSLFTNPSHPSMSTSHV